MPTGNPGVTDLSRLYFTQLSRAEQEAAIRRLAAVGHGEQTIAHATGLSVEVVRSVLTEPALLRRQGGSDR